MKRIIFTDEQIKDILGLYQDKSVKLADICNKHHKFDEYITAWEMALKGDRKHD